MMECCFLNVGDGDAAVFRVRKTDGSDYVLMIDTGRPALEYVKESLRAEALYGLKELGIGHVDLMILTHFHIDHMGGTANILRHLPVKRLLAPYIAPEGASWVRPPFETREKKCIGLAQMLNIWNDTVKLARERGTELAVTEEGTEVLCETPEGPLTLSTLFPCRELLPRQTAVLDTLYAGGTPDWDDWFRTSEDRNISGSLTRLSYAGHDLLLAADVYASVWEQLELAPCEILKLPHHGDPKAMTPYLAAVLHPRYAVISCQNDPAQKKDRPNAQTVRMLQDAGSEVLCTENKPLPTLAPSTHRYVGFRVTAEGIERISEDVK